MSYYKILFSFFLFTTSIRVFSQTPLHFSVIYNTDQVIPFPPYTPGTLRWAIEEANTHAGLDYIDFNISGSPPHTITLKSDLQAIRETVIMDGNTQPGLVSGNKKIRIMGKNATLIIGDYGVNQPLNNTEVRNIEFLNASSFTNPYTILYMYNNAKLNFTDNIVYADVRPNTFLMIITSEGSTFKNNILGTNKNYSTSNNFRSQGIRITNRNNTFGGLNPNEGNYFYNYFFVNSPLDIQAGESNKVSGNIFINNAKNIDIYSNVGCLGNICKQRPVYTAVTSGISTLISGVSSNNDLIEFYKSNSGGIDAISLLGTITANSSGQFNTILTGLVVGDKIIATATDLQNNTSEFSLPVSVQQSTISCTSISSVAVTPVVTNSCTSITATATIVNSNTSYNPTYTWNFGDGTPNVTGTLPASQHTIAVSHNYAAAGAYPLVFSLSGPADCGGTSKTQTIIVTCSPPPPPPCIDCIGSFNPKPGDTLVISTWVKEQNSLATKINYNFPKLSVEYPSSSASPSGPFFAKGQIIDGWQRLEEQFIVPLTATYLKIKLECTTGNCLFDDVRVFPKNGSMKSYVYDPQTMRLVAELDERNYATMYEYDEEGKLTRIKKETEKGIMTIQENKSSNTKK